MALDRGRRDGSFPAGSLLHQERVDPHRHPHSARKEERKPVGPIGPQTLQQRLDVPKDALDPVRDGQGVPRRDSRPARPDETLIGPSTAWKRRTFDAKLAFMTISPPLFLFGRGLADARPALAMG